MRLYIDGSDGGIDSFHVGYDVSALSLTDSERCKLLMVPDQYLNEEEKKNTPRRWRRFMDVWLAPMDYDELNKSITLFDNPGYEEMVCSTNLPFYSLCAHHILPFFGRVHIAYIPNKKIMGLSKLARIADYFARRPQTQERMTSQIADFIMKVHELKPKGCMVVVEAEHLCMSMRGIQKPGHNTITSALRGVFKHPPDGMNPRQEFLSLIRKSRVE